MLAPKSMRALPTDTGPIEQRIVTLPGSLCLGGRILWITTLQFPSTMILSLRIYLLFLVSRSFKNFEQNDICCKASSKGIIISNFLKMSRKRAKCHSLSFLDGTRGYGASFPEHETTSFFFSLANSFFVFFSSSFSFFSSFFSSFSFFSSSFIFFSQLIFFFFSYQLLLIIIPSFIFHHNCLLASGHDSFAFFFGIVFSISPKASRRIIGYLLSQLSYLNFQIIYSRLCAHVI